jgi:hypothetical protein
MGLSGNKAWISLRSVLKKKKKTGFLGFSAKEDTKDLRLFSLKYGLRRTPAMAVSGRDTKGQRST